jgi:hypothetical protein
VKVLCSEGMVNIVPLQSPKLSFTAISISCSEGRSSANQVELFLSKPVRRIFRQGEFRAVSWKRSRAPTLPHYGDGLNLTHRGLHRNSKDERTVATACLETCWTNWLTTTDRLIRTDTRVTHPGQERYAPIKAD